MEKKDTRRLILKKAFQLFATNTYEQVTYKELEDSTNLTRGAIMHYFKTKEVMFQEMCDEFILGENSALSQLNISISQPITLKDFIKQYIQSVKELKKISTQNYNIKNFNKAIVNIANQATYFYPDFELKRLKWQFIQRQLWKEVLLKAHQNKEIPESADVDTLAELFEDIYTGISYNGIVFQGGIDIDRLSKSFDLLYSMITKDKCAGHS